MAQPQLAGNTPRADIAHPAVEDIGPVLRHELGLAAFDRGNRLVGQRLDVQVPLLGEERLQHHALGLFVMRHRMGDGLNFVEIT